MSGSRCARALFDFAESPRFVREIRWAPGDLIVWDNRFLAHSSGRKKAPTDNILEEVKKEEETMMYRITLRDDYPLCATQMPAGTSRPHARETP
jgi:taurine dioxygenase